MRILTVLPLLLIVVVASAQLGAKTNQSNNLTGTWQNNQFGYQMTLMLNADGTGEFDGEMIKYVVKSSVLSITANNETNNYSYVLSGNSLTVSGGDLDQPVTFNKAGTTVAPTTVARTTLEESLVGIWSGNNESMEFKNDGRVLYNGNTFQYTTSNGAINLTSQQGTTTIPYTIAGNQLKLTINGQQFTYNKGAAQVSNTKPASTGQKTIPQELTGEWCAMKSTSTNSGGVFSSECLTLNPDGTYLYSTDRSMSVQTQDLAGGTSSQGGDRGQWWTEGDRIFYNSPTQGTGSYRLEKRNHPKNTGDPMIVLDGKAFVTTKLRQPWR